MIKSTLLNVCLYISKSNNYNDETYQFSHLYLENWKFVYTQSNKYWKSSDIFDMAIHDFRT